VQAPGQVQRGSGEGFEGSGEGLGGFGAEVRFNRVPKKVAEKIPEKVLGILGAGPGQVQRVPEKVAEKVPEKVAEKML